MKLVVSRSKASQLGVENYAVISKFKFNRKLFMVHA